MDGGRRLAAALHLGLKSVPVESLDRVEVQKRGSSVLLVGARFPPGGIKLNTATVRKINMVLFGRPKL